MKPKSRDVMSGSGRQPPARYAPRSRPQWGTLVLVGLLHLAAFAGLLRVFAPQFTSAVMGQATSLVSVTLSPDQPPEPPPAPAPAAQDAGVAAPEGIQATPREVAARPAILPRPAPAPPVASTGSANQSGAGERGVGTGAGGDGEGTGSGLAGNGSGAGAIAPPEKISGEINDARDFPLPKGGRAMRKDQHVIVQMTVGVDGRARNCRIIKASNDPQADRITCQLAEERFRFRPARDAAGNAVEAEYGWRQRWF